MDINYSSDKKYFRYIYLCGLFLIGLLPFLSSSPFFFPPDWGKLIVFRIIFSILIFFFVAQLLYQKDYREYIWQKIKLIPNYFSIPFALFALLLILSTIFSQEPFFSFWGSPTRSDGSFNFLLYILLACFSYLAIKKNDWKKVWIALLVGGLLVSFVAIAEQFNITGKSTLIAYSVRPPSTIGNPDALALYLLLLVFLSFAFGVTEKNRYKKIFFFSSLAVFLFVIILTLSRAAYFGLGLGLIWLLFFKKYNSPVVKKIKLFSLIFIAAAVILLLIFVTSLPILPDSIQQNSVIANLTSRFNINTITSDARFQTWKVGIRALWDKPLLGYGPENFSIGFDKYYNLAFAETAAWWDRAHNFLIEIGVTMGIPALLAYLAFWIAVFLFLQKRKKETDYNFWLYHAIQATIVAFFADKLFNFDDVPTFIISYLLIGYSFSLVLAEPAVEIAQRLKSKNRNGLKSAIMFILACGLVIFIWQYNIEPLKVNAATNWKDFYLSKEQINNHGCEKGISIMKSALANHTILDSYLRLEYMSILQPCLSEEYLTEDQTIEMLKEGVKAGQEAAKIEPSYTRTWIFIAFFDNNLMQNQNDLSLEKDAVDSLQKAAVLSPYRFETYKEWARTYLIVADYKNALDKANECLRINPGYGTCDWYKALADLGLKNKSEYEKYLALAKDNGFDTGSDESLKSIIMIYIQLTAKNPSDLDSYKEMAKIYKQLSNTFSNNYQYHASLAFVYRALGDYADARIEAQKVLELSPESKQNVEDFLKTLPY